MCWYVSSVSILLYIMCILGAHVYVNIVLSMVYCDWTRRVAAPFWFQKYWTRKHLISIKYVHLDEISTAVHYSGYLGLLKTCQLIVLSLTMTGTLVHLQFQLIRSDLRFGGHTYNAYNHMVLVNRKMLITVCKISDNDLYIFSIWSI